MTLSEVARHEVVEVALFFRGHNHLPIYSLHERCLNIRNVVSASGHVNLIGQQQIERTAFNNKWGF